MTIKKVNVSLSKIQQPGTAGRKDEIFDRVDIKIHNVNMQIHDIRAYKYSSILTPKCLINHPTH